MQSNLKIHFLSLNPTSEPSTLIEETISNLSQNFLPSTTSPSRTPGIILELLKDKYVCKEPILRMRTVLI